MNWDESVVIAADAVQKEERLRGRIQRVIWIGSRLPYAAILILALLVLLLGAVLRRRKMLVHFFGSRAF